MKLEDECLVLVLVCLEPQHMERDCVLGQRRYEWTEGGG